jgi:hypothetical protein
MLTKKKVKPIIGVALLAAMLFLLFGTPRYQSIKVKNENFAGLENKLKEAINTNTEIDIKKLTDFDWDECYVFTPYYPTEAIYEKVGAEWTTTKTYIEFLLLHNVERQTVNDDQYGIVFKKDSKGILSAKYSLNQLPVIFKLDNYKFTSSNAKFIVSAAKQYDEGKIKELVLK